jgi:serine/threonine protein kinase
MGQVYLARDTRLQRSIALKIMQPEAEGDASGQGASNGAARLLREAQSAAGLEHPNVVTIYEVGEIKGAGEEAGRPFIAMELVKGKALRAFVGDESVKMKERVRWLTDTARALAAAHRAGLIHRDIKPENVMIRDDGVVKVLDFGLAKRAASGTQSMSSSTEAQVLPSLTGKGIAIGTPYYMAPEQMRREPLDGRADQFAWGVVAYELLSGIPPWGREVDALELVSKLLSEDPTPLGEVRPDVPPHVAVAVTRAMSKRKGARFATMEELIAALEDEGGAFLPTMPRISVKEPEAPQSAIPPQVAAEKTGSVRPVSRTQRAKWFAVAGVVLAAVVTSVVLSKRAAPTAPPPSVSALAAARECAHNTECVAKLGGKPAVCSPSGKCTAIQSSACTPMFEPDDLKHDDTVWIGAMFALTGDRANPKVSDANAVELARRDFAQASVGIRRPDGTSPVHPLALVLCDDATDYGSVAAHLVNDVGTPAVIGLHSGIETVDLSTSIFVPRGVLVVPTITLTPLLASIPHATAQPRMVWRTTYNNAETAHATAALVERIEAQVRAQSSLRPADVIRVAVVHAKAAATTAYADALFDSVRINGKSALENGNAYREFPFEEKNQQGQFARLATDIAAFEPTIVLFASDGGLLPAIDAAWSAKRKPYYLTSTALDDEVMKFLGSNAERRHRVFGLTSVSTTTPNARFVSHYNESFSPPITRAWSPNSSYDGFYLVAYATYALGTKPVEGQALAHAIERLLPPGAPIDVGPTGILRAFGALARGEPIDLNGATGKLDFDRVTGEAPVDLAMLCADVDSHGLATVSIESGLVFDGARAAWSGEDRCP